VNNAILTVVHLDVPKKVLVNVTEYAWQVMAGMGQPTNAMHVIHSVLGHVPCITVDIVTEPANQVTESTSQVTYAAYVIPSVIRHRPVTHMDLEHVKQRVSSLVIH
jgi:hypothetical protein